MSNEFIQTYPERVEPIHTVKAHHCRVDAEFSGGRFVAVKTIPLKNYVIDPAELMRLYVEYRSNVQSVYGNIPGLIDIHQEVGCLKIEEDFEFGIRFDRIIAGGDEDKWLVVTDNLFSPLTEHVEAEPKIIGSHISRYPLDLTLDIKPANIIICGNDSDPDPIPVDFFPPLLRGKSGLYPHTKTLSEADKVRYVYGDFEVLLAKHFFETRSQNPVLAKKVSEEFLNMCDRFDQSGQLRNKINDNVIKSVAECPNCPYCIE